MSRMKFRIVVGPESGRSDEPAKAVLFDVSLFGRANQYDPTTFEALSTDELLDEVGCTSCVLQLYPDEAWALISSLIASGAGRIEADDSPTMTSVEYLREQFRGADEEEG